MPMMVPVVDARAQNTEVRETNSAKKLPSSEPENSPNSSPQSSQVNMVDEFQFVKTKGRGRAKEGVAVGRPQRLTNRSTTTSLLCSPSSSPITVADVIVVVVTVIIPVTIIVDYPRNSSVLRSWERLRR
ncbi:PREDICTED: uncharacterized protein LOC104808036 [Tarenaya hassleriana]|uniref:uncharacterized protein LOC104808036 n=1 Tax=Tarenaya hassleriana TaxID=28532 RepID=UPI00053C0CF6|nr:PREDICTED: uncharacterized protein LOC104808036 [Tarenaya hassleriana]